MNTPAQVVGEFSQMFGADAPEGAICARVLHFLCSTPPRQLRHLTLSRLREVALERPAQPDLDVSLVQVLNILSGARFRVLEQHFEFLSTEYEGEEEYFVLNNEQVKLAMTEGVFFHPQSGELVADFQKRIFIFYSPGEQLECPPLHGEG